MRIPARFAPILFGAILSVIMVAIVSAFVLVTTQGFQPGLPAQWLKSCLWASPDNPGTFDRWDDGIGGVKWSEGISQRNSSVRR